MVLHRNAVDADGFKFKPKEEITYSEDNKDYTIYHTKVIPAINKKFYLLKACDPTNPVQKLQLDATSENEAKMTKTNCLDVLTKVWPNLEITGSGQDFLNYFDNNVMAPVCDFEDGHTHSVKLTATATTCTLIFDGVEFTKSK